MAELFSFLPLLFCIVAMTVFNKPAKFSLPLTWVIACLGGILIWKMDLLSVAAYSLSAVFNSLDVLITIFGAILLMCTLKASGGTNSINNAFRSVSGILGAFISGSNTVSNTLFTNLQYQSAVNLGLSPVLFVAMQNIGGSVGNMICVNNVIAVCATVGIHGKEGKIIRANLLPCILYTLLILLVFALVIGVIGIVPAT